MSWNERKPQRPKLPTIGKQLQKISPLLYIKAWRQCAGPALLKQVQFLGVHSYGTKRVLKLAVTSNVWLQELSFQKKTLLIKFNETLKQLRIQTKDLATECQIQISKERKHRRL